MKIAFFHYHLNPGGVTRVIENHLSALDAVCEQSPVEVLIIVGSGDNALPDELPEQLRHVSFQIRQLPTLSYDASQDPMALADDVESILQQEHFHASDCILHVHNHALGKNVAWPQALWQLAERGYHMLLQIHDFIEDFRPQNYHKTRAAYANASDADFIKYLYPQADHIHYAVLNHRDHRILADAGISDSRLHVLPNPVFGAASLRAAAAARSHWAACVGCAEPQRLFVYPVRGITRKNIGEFLLHAALAEQGDMYAMTLAPANPQEQIQYQRWKDLAIALNVPCTFECGTVPGLSFEDNVAAADAIITTSVAEGFGMVYLEPWLMGRAMIGRDLPEITADFKANGLEFHGLYQRIPIPLEWIGAEVYARQWANTFSFALHSYGIDVSAGGQLKSQAMSQVIDDSVDFALLTVDLQRQVLQMLCNDQVKRDYLRQQLSPQLSIDSADNISAKQQHIREAYSFSCIGAKLLQYYQRIQAEQGGNFSTLKQPSAVIDGFLSASRFCPLRVSE